MTNPQGQQYASSQPGYPGHQPDQPPQYHPGQYQQAPYQAAPHQPGPPNYLAWSIISIFLFWPVAIAAIIKSTSVDRLWAEGHFDLARQASRTTRTLCIVCTILFVILVGLVVMFLIMAAAAVSQLPNVVTDIPQIPDLPIR